jgi:methylglutaconyl-CoA hydratase
MTVDGLGLERSGCVLVATIAKGDGNHFSAAMIDALAAAVEQGGADPALRFVRIRARGPVFCTGRERGGSTVAELRAEGARIVRLNEALRTSPLVSLAEVHGDAAGFGAGLVGACDVAVASEGARFSFPEITFGVAPAIVISWLKDVLPPKRVFELVATGRQIDAAEALALGLVTEVVSAPRLSARTDERLAELEALDAAALREIKSFLARARGLDPASAAAASVDALALGALRLRER